MKTTSEKIIKYISFLFVIVIFSPIILVYISFVLPIEIMGFLWDFFKKKLPLYESLENFWIHREYF